ncbi:hypothetical protein ACIOTI_16035 [Streptomyces sp. NPDC087843]|uniref:hypothetical protein n=1 Tax=Streptomyces sp. NPDC087843 TaxID=3365804 RepID=UPI0037FA81C9
MRDGWRLACLAGEEGLAVPLTTRGPEQTDRPAGRVAIAGRGGAVVAAGAVPSSGDARALKGELRGGAVCLASREALGVLITSAVGRRSPGCRGVRGPLFEGRCHADAEVEVQGADGLALTGGARRAWSFPDSRMTRRQLALSVRQSASSPITPIQSAVRLFPLGGLFGETARSGTFGWTRGVANFRSTG